MMTFEHYVNVSRKVNQGAWCNGNNVISGEVVLSVDPCH